MTNPEDCDRTDLMTEVLIVGAGFAGIYLLHRLRQQGFQCKIFEAGDGIGGTWYWNQYPGARVDTPSPIYALPFEEVWKDWNWSTRYPDYREMRAYFDHVAEVLDIKRDMVCNRKVVAARFDEEAAIWTVQTQEGKKTLCKFLLLATGFTSRRFAPDIPGVTEFQGTLCHSSLWPSSGIDLLGKRVGVIGTGATGVQLIQEACKIASSVTVFQRTPNLCLPMRQEMLDPEKQTATKSAYRTIYKQRMTTFGGYLDDFLDRSIFDDTPEVREIFFEELWQQGGFKFWIANYKDILVDPAANALAYDFWVRKTRSRISDETKRDILAPLIAPHPWGVKRPCLEQDYFEELSKPQHQVINVRDNPIEKITNCGIELENGDHHELDVIVLATGFDALTGGLKDIDIMAVDGTKISDRWEKGVRSYLGTTLSGCPNLFYIFAAHAPAASNGPSCIELQGSWIVDAMVKMRAEGVRHMAPSLEAEKAWTEELKDICSKTLIPTTRSWYMGGNVPGKCIEPLIYFGGFPSYKEKCFEVLNQGFKGFVLSL